jgi:hypothetical protein
MWGDAAGRGAARRRQEIAIRAALRVTTASHLARIAALSCCLRQPLAPLLLAPSLTMQCGFFRA